MQIILNIYYNRTIMLIVRDADNNNMPYKFIIHEDHKQQDPTSIFRFIKELLTVTSNKIDTTDGDLECSISKDELLSLLSDFAGELTIKVCDFNSTHFLMMEFNDYYN